MIDRRELLLFGTASVAVAATSSTKAAPRHAVRQGTKTSAVTRAAEIRALRKFAEETHPRGREARDNAEWQRRWARLERNANVLPDGSYFVEARRALAGFEDGHTTVLPFEHLGRVPDSFAAGPFSLHLPWRVKLFDDGAYVVGTSEEERSILGARVEQVGRVSTAALISAFDATWPGNRAWAHSWGGVAFASPAQLQGLGALSDPWAPLPVKLAAASGPANIVLQPTREKLAPLHEMVRTKSARELWGEAAHRGNYVKFLPERAAIYLSIDGMDDVEGATFEQLTKEAFAAMESSPADRLVIDLRRNGGGNNFLGEPLRKRIERSSINQPGRLFVLIGPATFSAAQNLVNRLERETYAIFIGRPTGLSPNHYGDARSFTGPATGLIAMVSTVPWFDSYPEDRRKWVMPDLLVRTTFDDWRTGRDPELDAALTEKFVGLPDDLSRDRVFYFSRGSQKQEWKPFWA